MQIRRDGTPTRLREIWRKMIQRCRENHKDKKYYHSKGICVCERWMSYENFCQDMMRNYLEHIAGYGESNTSLDRIDPCGCYAPENCRWATKREQVMNQTCRKILQPQ